MQAFFLEAVKEVLPSAIPSRLDKIDECHLGKVLIYREKPRWLLPLRKHHLDFTGWSLHQLLAGEEKKLPIKIERSFMFDSNKRTSSRAIKVNIKGNLDMEDITKLYGTDVHIKGGGKGSKKVAVISDFGKVTHVTCDIVNTVVEKKIKLRQDHPIVQQAFHKGSVMFVIASIYEGEHCKLSVNASGSVQESASADVNVKAVDAGGSEAVDDSDGFTEGMYVHIALFTRHR